MLPIYLRRLNQQICRQLYLKLLELNQQLNNESRGVSLYILYIFFQFSPSLLEKKLGGEYNNNFAAGEKMNLVQNIHP